MQQSQRQITRRPKAAISVYSLNVLHLRNPLTVAWWGLVYPGFGHFRVISTTKAILLFAAELLINTQAHLNLAIIYSLTGNFAMAKEVLNPDLLPLYCAILVYSVWDSHRLALEINKLSVLADHEKAPMVPISLSSTGINAYDKRNPWTAAAWAALAPGLGHLYCIAVIQAVFLIVSGAVIIYFSHLIPAIEFTAVGQLAQAKEVIDWQWLLNLPSFYCFSIYDAYAKTVEYNKLFDQEQAQYLKNTYQSPPFKIPLRPVQGE